MMAAAIGHNAHPPHRGSAYAVARGLGWFSIGLGLAELLAPKDLARSLGMEGKEVLIRAYGAREVATGVAILGADDPTPWILGRVGGDLLDLATLALAPREIGVRGTGGNVAAAFAAVAAVTVVDALCAQGLHAKARDQDEVVRRAIPDYGRRSGFRRPVEAMRGAARDFEVPEDMRIPEPLRPWSHADA